MTRPGRPALAAICVAVLVTLLGAWNISHLRWADRPWEVTQAQLAAGENPYTLNLRSRATTLDQTGWPYGPASLIALIPVYRAAVAVSGGDPRPAGFPWACGALALLAHLMLMREAWRLSGRGPRGVVAVLAVGANPFLIRLDGEGDVLDLPMLWLLLAAVRTEEEGAWRRSGLALGLSLAIKQAGLLYLPVWLWRHRREPFGLVVLGLALALPAAPFLVWDPAAFGLAMTGAASAYRNFVQLDWWNQFARQLQAGVPAQALRVVSGVLTAAVVATVAVVAPRRPLRPLAALTLVMGCAWVTYYSAYSLYLGWWTVIASVLVVASL